MHLHYLTRSECRPRRPCFGIAPQVYTQVTSEKSNLRAELQRALRDTLVEENALGNDYTDKRSRGSTTGIIDGTTYSIFQG